MSEQHEVDVDQAMENTDEVVGTITADEENEDVEQGGDEPTVPATPRVVSERPRPFAPDVFRSLANFDGIGGRDGQGHNNRQHYYNGRVVRDWLEFRNGKQIDAEEHRLLFGPDGRPVNCSRCGNLFQPYWVRVLRGDLRSLDLMDFGGSQRSFTENDLETVCALGKGVFEGRIMELGNFLALTWQGQVVDEGVYCGTPWFDNLSRNQTFVNNHGCLGTTRNSWGDVQAQWRAGHQIGWMADRFERELPTDQLDALADLIDQLDNWEDSEGEEESSEVQSWKNVVRIGVKKIQEKRGQSSNLFDKKLADLFTSLNRPSALQCFSQNHLEILIASKAGNSDAGRAINRRRTQREVQAEKNRIRDKVRGGRHHDTAPKFGQRLNLPGGTQT